MKVKVSAGASVRSGRGSTVSQGTIGGGGGGAVPEGVWVVKGNWDASTNVFPSASVKAGYQYKAISNSTTLLMPDGGIIPEGTLIVAMIDDPGQDVDNWYFVFSVI